MFAVSFVFSSIRGISSIKTAKFSTKSQRKQFLWAPLQKSWIFTKHSFRIKQFADRVNQDYLWSCTLPRGLSTPLLSANLAHPWNSSIVFKDISKLPYDDYALFHIEPLKFWPCSLNTKSHCPSQLQSNSVTNESSCEIQKLNRHVFWFCSRGWIFLGVAEHTHGYLTQ